MEIKYKVYENENLFVQCFSGEFSCEDYCNYSIQITEDLVSKPIKKILIDFRNITFGEKNGIISYDSMVNLEKMIEFRKNMNQNKLNNRVVNVVIWVDRPMPTVIAQLFTSNFSKESYQYCSTRESIIIYLSLPNHLFNLDDLIQNLEPFIFKTSD